MKKTRNERASVRLSARIKDAIATKDRLERSGSYNRAKGYHIPGSRNYRKV